MSPTDGQSDRDLGVGLSRLKADAVNLQAGDNQYKAFRTEQRRDVSYLLIFLCGVILLLAGLTTLWTANLAYVVLASPFLALLCFLIFRSRQRRHQIEKLQKKQFEEFTAKSEREM